MRNYWVGVSILVAVGCGSTAQDAGSSPPAAGAVQPAPATQSFSDALSAGASCADLFAIRNAMNADTSLVERMNADLSYVGCTSPAAVRKADPAAAVTTARFTVREYRIYRAFMAAPGAMSEAEAFRIVGRRFSLTADETKAVVLRVGDVIIENKWMGQPAAEIRHASDWKGETE